MNKDFTLSIGNIIWIVGIIFTMGTAYSQISHLEEHIVIVEKRLDKKIKLLNECEDKIIEIVNSIDVDSTGDLQKKSKEIQELIIKTEVPEDIQKGFGML